MILKRLKYFALIPVIFFAAGNCFAAAQVMVVILTDLDMGKWSMNDPAVTGHLDVCITATSNTPSGSYAINVSSPGGFKLTNTTASTYKIPYQIYWDDSGTGNLGSNGSLLTNGTTLTGRQHANTSSLNTLCALGASARMNFKITQADMTSALAGKYTGTITLLVSPN